MEETLEVLELRVTACWFTLIAAEREGADDATLSNLCRAYLEMVRAAQLATVRVALDQSA